MNTLQILGIVIPSVILLSSFIYSTIKISRGEGDEPVPKWEIISVFISTLVLIFTLGTSF